MNNLTPYISPRYAQAVERLMAWLNAEAPKNSDVSTLLNQLNSGEKVLKEAHHYFRKKIVTNAEPSAIIEVIKNTDEKEVGVASFDKGKLSKGEIMVVSHVGIGYSTNTGGGGLYAQDVLYQNNIFDPKSYANGTVDTDAGATGNQFFPVESQKISNKFLSSEIKFKFGNEIWLEGLFRNFTKANKLNAQEGLGAFDSGAAKELGIPKILDDSKQIGLTIEFPANATAAGAADYYLGIDFYGIKIVDKA